MKVNDGQKEKLKAALDLLCDTTTSLDKIQKVSTLLKGIHPKIDKHLEVINKAVDKLQLIQDGDLITLSAKELPETTDEHKKRKKALLLIISNWKSLQSEVGRISQLQAASSTSGLTGAGKIIATAKGPLGLVTVAAVGVVAITGLIASKSVKVNIRNEGCGQLGPVTAQAINLPGLKLPVKGIPSGESDTATLPGLDFKVDATAKGVITLTGLSISRTFTLPYEYKEIIFNGQSIIGKTTDIKLSGSKTHEVIFKCI